MLNSDATVRQQVKSCGFLPIEKKGSGSFGYVYEVSDNKGDLFAFKYNILDPEYEEIGITSLNEIDILSRINHPNIIHAAKIITPHNCQIKGIGIVLPLADRSFFHIMRDCTMPSVSKLPIMYKIANAVKFLHESNILHLDIKSNNIVLQASEPYLIDFGLSIVVDDILLGKEDTIERVTLDYRCPELLNKDVYVYNSAVDVWSLGILFLYTLGGRVIYPPNYDKLSNIEFEQVVINTFKSFSLINKLLLGISKIYRHDWIDLITGMLTINPHDRLTMAQVCNHPVFATVKQDITGSLSIPNINYNYAEDHRSVTKLLLYWVKQIYPKTRVELLFLSVDMLNRVSSYYKKETIEIRIIAAASCLWCSSKLTGDYDMDISEYCEELCKITPITVANILQQEISIVHYLNGILQVNELYNSCKNLNELRLSFDNIIMSTDSTLYARVDIPSWIKLIRTDEDSKQDKNILIEEFIQ